MATNLWGVLCQRVITDRETNSVSYIDAVEAISVPDTPGEVPPLTLALMWRREQESELFQLRFQIFAPGTGEIRSLETDEFRLQSLHHRTNFQFTGVPVNEPGDLVIFVDQMIDGNWRRAYNISVPVVLAEGD